MMKSNTTAAITLIISLQLISSIPGAATELDISSPSEVRWSLESNENTGIYLKGETLTNRGVNKFIVNCQRNGKVALFTFHDPEGDVISIKKMHAASIIINGKAMPLLGNHTGVVVNGLIYGIFHINENIIDLLINAQSVGIEFYNSDNPSSSSGFDDMDFREGAKLLPGLIKPCRRETSQWQQSHHVDKEMVMRGINQAIKTYNHTGMAGVMVNVDQCHERLKHSHDFAELVTCQSVDLTGYIIDDMASNEQGFPATPYFEKHAFQRRFVTIMTSQGISHEEAETIGSYIQNIVEPILTKNNRQR